MNKKINLKIIPKMVREAKKLGYFIPAYFMLGFPNETYATARQTIQFAKSLPLDRAVFFLVQPLPGSKLFNDLIQKRDPGKMNEYLYYFFTHKNNIEITDGKKKIVLPRDAYREFILRPKQIFRSIRFNIEAASLRQLLLRLKFAKLRLDRF